MACSCREDGHPKALPTQQYAISWFEGLTIVFKRQFKLAKRDRALVTIRMIQVSPISGKRAAHPGSFSCMCTHLEPTPGVLHKLLQLKAFVLHLSHASLSFFLNAGPELASCCRSSSWV